MMSRANAFQTCVLIPMLSVLYIIIGIILVTPIKANPHLQKPQGQNGGFKHLLGATKTSFLRGGGFEGALGFP